MCSYSVMEVFPIGALPRKSLAMGFTQRTNTMTGDRKLMWSKILKKIFVTLRKQNTAEITLFWRIECITSYWMSGLSEFICTASR